VTGAQTLAAFRRALVPALLAAIITLAAVVGLMLSRPPSYLVRVGLIATPVTHPSLTAQTTDFGQVVTMAMPSLPEFVVADDVLSAIHDQVPGAPAAGVLRSAITVELVPASGVARIAVTTDDPTVSRKVLAVVLAEIAKADLLAPVATLKTIGSSDPAPQVVGRDVMLAAGIGLVAAIAVSLLTVVLVQTVRPRLLTRADVERIVDSLFENEVGPPVVEVRPDGRGLDLLSAYLLAQDPHLVDIRVATCGPAFAGDFGRQLRTSLRKVRTAREAGLALDPLVDADAFSGASRALARHRSMSASLQDGADPDGAAPLVTVLDSLGSGDGGAAGPDDAGQARLPTVAPGHHLVLTVRLRRTTPVALTTALITLRSHGTGVAGLAVS
jgi:hypothetical protein